MSYICRNFQSIYWPEELIIFEGFERLHFLVENELFEGLLDLSIVLKAWKNKFSYLLPNLNGMD